MDTHPTAHAAASRDSSVDTSLKRTSVEHYEKAPLSSSVSSAPGSQEGPVSYRRVPLSWMRLRETLREPLAEFIGIAILIIFGNGVNCQVTLNDGAGDWNTINIGWGVGTMMGVWVSAGISGGHINPAVTLALATFRGFPWKKVPVYIAAQVLGAFTGAAIVYANYFHAINAFEGGAGVRTELTRGLFATYAKDYMTNISAFFDEVIGTFVLMIVVLAIGDKKNCPVPAGLAPLALYFLVLGLGASLGVETAYAINPARDFGPRLLTAAAGYGSEIWTYRSNYWIWCPIIGPICGAQLAAVVYDSFLYTGDDSAISKRLVAPPEPVQGTDVEKSPAAKV